MPLRPQKDCSFPEGQTPAPTPVLSLPCQPILCTTQFEGDTEGWRGENVCHRLSGLIGDLHLSICEAGQEGE